MTDIYTQENGSKKKFLAPVLVILLCMVSLTAAGYAYSATVNNEGDTGVVEGVTMELVNGSAIVAGPMYTIGNAVDSVDKLDVATHIVNGKAANPNGKAFLDNDAGVADYNVANLATYEDGYYVEVFKNDVSNGYQATVDYTTVEALTTAKTAANAGVFEIGAANDYHLKVTNESDGNVALSATITKTGSLGCDGVKHIYLTFVGEGVSIVKDVLADSSFDIKTIADHGTLDLTIKAYVVITDYCAAELPNVAAAGLTFGIGFSAATPDP